MKGNFELEPGDIACVNFEKGHNEGTKFYCCSWCDGFKDQDIVVVEKVYEPVAGLDTLRYDPLRYKVRNTQNGYTFVITYDKLEVIDGVSVDEEVYDLEE